MSDATKPFAFSQFVPGFDFLKNLAGSSATAGAVPGMPSLSNWVAPTLSVEEVDKRIQELKTVQYWLEQNGHALKATIQALEVQKMTLSTLRGMNLRMEDLASAFTRASAAPTAPVAASSMFRTEAEAPAPAPVAAPVAAPAVAPAPEPAPAAAPRRSSAKASAPSAGADGAGVVDPLQWWGALTQQFQQIAASALHDAAQLKMPQPAVSGAAAKAAARTTPVAAKKSKPRPASRRVPPAGAANAANAKAPALARKRAR